MEINIAAQKARVPVTVVQPHGDLDASNYTELIDRVRRLIMEGAQDFLIDLGHVPFMSSSGLMAIHTIALMLQGERVPDGEVDRARLKTMDRSRAGGIQKHVKLAGLQPSVAETLEKAGFMQFFEIFDDVQKAVAAF